MKRKGNWAALWLGGWACAASAWAAEPQPPYDLQELTELALRHTLAVGEGSWKVAGAQARLRQVEAARFLPRLRLESTSGLVPAAEGDIFNPPQDTAGLRELGPFTQAELEFIQPLYVAGAAQLWRAAQQGVAAEEAALQGQRLELELEVAELYYGLLLARQLGDLAVELRKKIEDKRSEIEDNPAIPLSGHYKFQLALVELDKQQQLIAQKKELALAALAWKTGLKEGESAKLESQGLAPETAVLPPLDSLCTLAFTQRPDWRRLQAGLQAKDALAQAARGGYYPQVVLSGALRYAVAPRRTDQHNPFVKDEFNYLNGGVVLRLRQALEWDLIGAEVDKARAEYQELKAKERVNAQGLRVDVQRAYGEYQQAAAELGAATEVRRLSRQWAREAQEAFELDPEEAKELIAGFEAWAQSEQAYYEAVYRHNVALVELEKTTGGLSLRGQP
ncbi:MAG: TolC family protein [Candidatus Latescibacteria bacterium]|nr:TolC family protein [Candidatus Latescibacterota bacterium]